MHMGIGIRSDVRSRVGTWERPWTIDKKLGPTYTIRTAKRKEPELPVLPSTIYMEPASSVGRRGRSCGLLQMTARCDACTQAVNWLLQAACSTGSNATCCHMCACFAIGKACLGKVSHGSESRFIADRTSPQPTFDCNARGYFRVILRDWASSFHPITIPAPCRTARVRALGRAPEDRAKLSALKLYHFRAGSRPTEVI
jgi:hypothetical protein